MKTISLFIIFLFSIMVLLLGSGCATNRGILDLKLSLPPNPPTGQAVVISRVTDKRVFEKAPKDPSIPSLKEENEIKDKSITVRAIARKRTGWGKALGDILLPENRTVEDLVKEVLIKAFREAGYYVYEGSFNVEGEVVPIEADIEQFWAWIEPAGPAPMVMKFEALVRIKGNLPPFNNEETIRSFTKTSTPAGTTRAWVTIFNQGINTFITDVKKLLTANTP